METSRLSRKVLIGLVFLCFLGGGVYSQQQRATVLGEANIKAFSIFLVDGTDAGWNLSGNEIIDLGNVDARGTSISGAFAGNPNVNNIRGVPVAAGGAPLSHPDDPACVGAFYPFFQGTGGNSNNQHPNSAISIFLLTFDRWRITTSAQLISSSANVTVDQLKWKYDETQSSGFQDYRGFTSSQQLVASGFGAWQFFYLDFGLLVEYEDGSGPNTWIITYTLTTD